MQSTRDDIAHLLRRVGFGPRSDEVDEFTRLGWSAAVDQLCDLGKQDIGAESIPSPAFRTAEILSARRSPDEATRAEGRKIIADEQRSLVRWWLERMIASTSPLREKLTFLWHDHFATSMQKVEIPEAMHRHHRTLHVLGPGRFDALVEAISTDPAMLIWLDGAANSVGAPNENFAREVFELFTLGHGGTSHGGHSDGQPYTENDIEEAARALTGWVIDPGTGATRVDPVRHDSGEKTILGVRGNLGLEDVVRIATRRPECASHVVSRLFSRIVRPAGPDDPVVGELASGFADDLDTTELLRNILLHPDFRKESTRGALVKTPVEYVVGTIRALELDDLDERVGRLLATLGQLPFFPPSVAGWPANEAWLSTHTSLVRMRVANLIAGAVEVPDVADSSPADRPEAVGHVLSIPRWSDSTAAALREASGSPKEVLTVALISPEHMVA